jgi:hypothetical protein
VHLVPISASGLCALGKGLNQSATMVVQRFGWMRQLQCLGLDECVDWCVVTVMRTLVGIAVRVVHVE